MGLQGRRTLSKIERREGRFRLRLESWKHFPLIAQRAATCNPLFAILEDATDQWVAWRRHREEVARSAPLSSELGTCTTVKIRIWS